MKSYLKLLLKLSFVFLLCFGFAALADPSPSPSPLAASGLPSTLDGWKLLLPVIGGLVVAVLDFIFAINPSAKSNGILHWLFLLAGGKETPPA